MKPTEIQALFAFGLATVVAAALTPLTMRLARRVGAIDQPRERGLATRPTPLLGGLAIFAGILVGGALWLPGTRLWHGVLLAAALITLVGALDDRYDLPPGSKLVGQIVAALVAVHFGVVAHSIRLPLLGLLTFPNAGFALTTIALVGMMNVVNFSDGVDGLAAGVCSIIAGALAVIAFDVASHTGLQHAAAGRGAGLLAALIAGACLGFLLHNFHPASSFMGDCGSNLLGLLMGCVAVEGTVKAPVLVSFVVPLILLAVPFLDTTFVVLKRLKYKRAIYRPDAEHFHHRLARIGFSQRRTVLYFYAWTAMLAGLALALRFVPYSDHHGHLQSTGWTVVMGLIALLVAAASIYLVYVLEILKFRRLAAIRLRRAKPQISDQEIERTVADRLETGEWEVVRPRE